MVGKLVCRHQFNFVPELPRIFFSHLLPYWSKSVDSVDLCFDWLEDVKFWS